MIKKYYIKISVFIISFSFFSFSQGTDFVKWEKSVINYKISSDNNKGNYSFSGDDVIETSAKAFTNLYWFFISDLDGDNCPFTPSCSEFFVESVKETNILQGTLMFFDRFTRDLNFYERHEHYPRSPNGRFFDPPSLYQLDRNKTSYLVPASDINE